jgi:hypothetical protein
VLHRVPAGAAKPRSLRPNLCSDLSDVRVLERLLLQNFQAPHIPSVPQPMEIRDASYVSIFNLFTSLLSLFGFGGPDE